jgi:hypothetical protein
MKPKNFLLSLPLFLAKLRDFVGHKSMISGRMGLTSREKIYCTNMCELPDDAIFESSEFSIKDRL